MLYEKSKFGYDLTKESATKSITIQIEKKITYDNLETIIVNGLEGGVNYWSGLDNSLPEWDNEPEDMPTSQYAFQLLIEGKSIKFYDIEESEDDSSWILTLEKLLNGIKLNCQERPEDSDIKNGDSITYDCIIQYALFNKVIYG